MSAGNSYGNSNVSGGQVQFGDIHVTQNVSWTSKDDPPPTIIPSISRSNTSRESAPLFFVPRCAATYFTGRTLELAQLHQYLHTGASRTHRIVVIEGLGGAGKTQFCLKYAETRRNSYAGIFWIDGSSRKSVEDCYAELGLLFGKGAAPGAGKYWLSQSSRPWLLILDNADAIDLEMSLLLPPGSSGHIVITTRNRNVCEIANAGIIRLTQMDAEEATELLLTSAYPVDDVSRSEPRCKHTAGLIAKELGYLAMAVRQAGTAIRRRIYTLDKYLSSYLGHRNRLLPQLESFSPALTKEDKETITTWEIPFSKMQISAGTQPEDAISLLHVLACFHHISLHQSLFDSSYHKAASRLEEPKSLHGLFGSPVLESEEGSLRLRMAIGLLHDYSIIEQDTAMQTCSMHPVVHDWVRYKIKQQGSMEHWLDVATFVLARVNVDDLVIGSSNPAFALLPHIDSLLDLVGSMAPPILETAEGCARLERFAAVFERAGQFRRALDLVQTVVTVRTRMYGKRHRDTLRAKRYASMLHWNLFEVRETIDLQTEIWRANWVSRPSILDWIHPLYPMHTDYLLSLSDLSQSLWLAGQRQLSRRAGERAVKGLRKLYSENHQYTVDAMFNLGRTYRHIGLLDMAQSLLKKVLGWRKKSLGLDHLDTLMVRNEIAMAFYNRRERLDVAERIVRNVLAQRQAALGDEHAYTLWSVNDLSKVVTIRGRPLEAVQILEEIVPAVERTLGGKHVGMQMTKGNIARAYASNKDWEKAEKLLAQIAPMIPPEHPDRVYTMIGYTRILIRQSKFEEAEQACKDVEVLLIAAGKARPKDKDMNSLQGLKAETYKGRSDLNSLASLRQKWPTLNEYIMDEEFELV